MDRAPVTLAISCQVPVPLTDVPLQLERSVRLVYSLSHPALASLVLEVDVDVEMLMLVSNEVLASVTEPSGVAAAMDASARSVSSCELGRVAAKPPIRARSSPTTPPSAATRSSASVVAGSASRTMMASSVASSAASGAVPARNPNTSVSVAVSATIDLGCEPARAWRIMSFPSLVPSMEPRPRHR